MITEGLSTLPKLSEDSRLSWEGIFFEHLGADHIRIGQYEPAIEAYSRSLSSREHFLELFRGTSTAAQASRQSARVNALLSIGGLARAHRLAKKLDEAVVQYERALSLIQTWRLRYVYENGILADLGDLYFQQKRFGEALASLKRALALSEKLRYARKSDPA